MFRRARVAFLAVGALLHVWAAPASAYKFDVRAFTLGQGYQLRLFRPLSGDVLLNRRRFTQTLSLDIWNIGKPTDFRIHDSKLDNGPNYFFTSFLRIDHDFGEYTSDEVLIGAEPFDATDLVPELHTANLNLDVLFVYGGAHGLGGFLDVEVGRQLIVDTLDWWSFDGAMVRAKTPWMFAVEAFGGTRVRDSSMAGSSVQEPDGTAGSECTEYVEGAVPGSGSWRPIDRAVPGGDNPFESEFDVCPQRNELMPTFGGAVETTGASLRARVAYRRTVSRTPEIIGLPNRFEFTDTGFYPDETGAAPGWGVNEERIAASVGYDLRFAKGRGQLSPFAAGRYSVLHGLVDEANTGVRFRYGPHALAPEYFYSFPTFDGDSIFNVFSTRPYHDARVTYELKPRDSALSGYVRGWLRRFGAEDLSSDGDKQDELSGGAQVGGRYRHNAFSYARLDIFHEDGFGGRRSGAYGSARWRLTQKVDVASRLSLIYFDEDLLEDIDGTTFGGQLGVTYRMDQGIALHLTVEENTNRFYDSQFRAIGVLDMAFEPEL